MASENTQKKVNTQASDVIEVDVRSLFTPAAIVIAGIFLSISLIVGLNSIASNLDKIGLNTTATGTTGAVQDTTGTAPAPTVSFDQIQAIFQDDGAMVIGDKNSDVLLVEFSDPSCPFCHIASGKNPELNTSAGAQFTLVSDGGTYVAPVDEFRKLVASGDAAFVQLYTNGHGNGQLAAQAQYCAHEKGKFWEVHDLLMNSEGYTLINDVVQNDVAKAGQMADFLSSAVDKNFMEDCLESQKYADRLVTDQQLAGSLGVAGTPGFFVNETNFPGAYSYTDMKSIVDSLL